MKKILSVFLTCIMIFSFSACSSENKDAQSLLSTVLNSEKTFIAEDGTAVLLKNYFVGNGERLANPTQFVFVDFDDDNIEEMVINISDLGYFLVLRVDEAVVYGYEFSARTLNSLKTDGSFSGSNGAASAYYNRLSFENNKPIVINEAVADSDAGHFELNGENASPEEVEEFAQKWHRKKDVEWTKVENNTTNDSSVINLNNYISVKFSGTDLEGYGSVAFDKEKFLLDHIGNVSFNKENLQVYRELYGYPEKSAANTILKYISVSLDKVYNLSNGDTVKVVWNIDTEKVETYFVWDYICPSVSLTVTGLSPAKPQGNTTVTGINDTNSTKPQENTTTLNDTNPTKPQGNTTTLNDANPTKPQENAEIYEIRYVNNGGTHSNPTTYTIEDEISLAAPKKTGYTFLGWTYAGQETPVLNVRIPKGSTGDKQYTANWKARIYKITYDANGGSVNRSTQSVSYDSYYTPAEAEKKGYTFAGWYEGETEYYAGMWKTHKNVTLKAKWDINSYSVSVSGTSGGSVSGSGRYTYNSTVTVSAKSKLGYTWLGWYDTNNNRLSAKQSYSFTIGDANITLTGKWKTSDDIADFKFTSTENTCTITDVIDDSKSIYTIPNYVTSIDDWAFFMCDYLTSITIPNSVTSIGSQAFSGCENLASVTIPNSVTSIGKNAFSGCKMTSIVIPKGITSISEYMFSGCSNLTNAVIHGNITSIGKNAFSGCSKLASITFQGNKAEWNAITLGSYWNHMVPATNVVCADGTVALS